MLYLDLNHLLLGFSSHPPHFVVTTKGFHFLVNNKDLNSKLQATSIEHQLSATSNTQSQRALPYLFRTYIDDDGFVKVYVSTKNVTFSVCIEGIIIINWPCLGASTHPIQNFKCCWKRDQLNPVHQHFSGNFVIELEFEAKHVPCYLSFFLKSDDGLDFKIRSHRKTNFCVPVGSLPGYPAPLDLSFSPNASINFAIFSRHANSVVLCLHDHRTGLDKPALQLDLDPYVNRSGDIWHISFETASNFVSYGYRLRTNKDNDYDYAEHLKWTLISVDLNKEIKNTQP